jgi:starvation-inducible DNA-binding protein
MERIMATKLNPTRNDLPSKIRAQIVYLLNQSLADAVDLHSQVKQAHWNVKGPQFIALHELFDKVAGEIDGQVDEIAERATALGGTALGTARLAAKHSRLLEYPHDISSGPDHIAAVSERLAAFGKTARAAIDTASELKDADTADLFTGVSREVDKLLWFVEAHAQG